MFFKDEYHEKLFYKFSEKMGIIRFDREYTSLIYCLSAVGKERLIEFIDEDGVEVGNLLDEIAPYSQSEIALVRSGLNLFNSSIDDISISDAFYHLDDSNTNVLIEAIKMRFK